MCSRYGTVQITFSICGNGKEEPTERWFISTKFLPTIQVSKDHTTPQASSTMSVTEKKKLEAWRQKPILDFSTSLQQKTIYQDIQAP